MIEEFIHAAKEGLTVDIEQMLKENPQLLHAIKENGESPLMAALYHGKQTVVQQLLEYGVAITLHEAAALGELETVKYLVLEENAPISEFSYDGWTPLHLAAFFGDMDTAEFLIQHGADVNAVSTNKQTNMPIHAATAGRKFAIVQLLLEHHASPNVQQQGGWTPLMQAVHNFDFDLVKLLLSFAADAELVGESGQTAKSIAIEQDYENILELLNRK